MFTIFLWDTDKYQSEEQIDNMAGNEKFLIPIDEKKYFLLGNLSSCEEDLFSGELLNLLRDEIENLVREYDNNEIIKKYLIQLLNLTNKAIKLNKSVLITPFVEGGNNESEPKV